MLNRTYVIEELGGFRWKEYGHDDHISLEWSVWSPNPTPNTENENIG